MVKKKLYDVSNWKVKDKNPNYDIFEGENKFNTPYMSQANFSPNYEEVVWDKKMKAYRLKDYKNTFVSRSDKIITK